MKHGTTKTLRVGCILLAIFFLFCAFALLPQPVQAANTVTATVTVGSEPGGVAVTPNGAYAYVTNLGSNSVSVISTATTASPSPTIPEFPAQLLIITLVVFMITGLSAVIIAKKRITRAEKVHGNSP